MVKYLGFILLLLAVQLNAQETCTYEVELTEGVMLSIDVPVDVMEDTIIVYDSIPVPYTVYDTNFVTIYDTVGCNDPEIPDPPIEIADFVEDFETDEWEQNFKDYFGGLTWQYEHAVGNTYSIVNDPTGSSNKVLKLEATEATSRCNCARIQGSLEMSKRKIYHYSQDMFISENMEQLESSNLWTWFGVTEAWEQVGNDGSQRARFSYSYEKSQSGDFVHVLNGEVMNPNRIKLIDVPRVTDPVIYGEWKHIEVYFSPDVEDGIFWVKVNDEIVFDYTGQTSYFEDFPIQFFQPWRIYMYGPTFEHIGEMQIYYDNFKWYDHRTTFEKIISRLRIFKN